jgi:hypothetical protein
MNAFHRSCCLAALALTLAGCEILSYSLVPVGARQVGSLEFDVAGAWNAVPRSMTTASRDDAQTWTRNGVLFDFEATVVDGPKYKGVVGMIKTGDELYVMMYPGADPHYFDKTLPDAMAQIQSARLKT